MDRICNTLIYEGSGPDKQQDGSHVHFSLISPGGYLLVANLGCDTVTVYKMDAEDKLHRMENMSVRTPAGRGPRHMCFPGMGADSLFPVSAAILYWFMSGPRKLGWGTCFKRSLFFKRLLSALRNWRISSFLMTEDMYTCAFAGQTSCAASLVCDRLSAPNWFPSGGKSPRAMAITEDDKFIVAANANMVAVLPRDLVTGEVGGAIASCPVGHSTCVTIMK